MKSEYVRRFRYDYITLGADTDGDSLSDWEEVEVYKIYSVYKR